MPVTKDHILYDFKWVKLMVYELYHKAVKKRQPTKQETKFLCNTEAYTIFINIIHKIRIWCISNFLNGSPTAAKKWQGTSKFGQEIIKYLTRKFFIIPLSLCLLLNFKNKRHHYYLKEVKPLKWLGSFLEPCYQPLQFSHLFTKIRPP